MVQIRTDATHAIFVYYGAAPNFADTAADQSGDNMLDKTDVRFDTSQYAGGTFYDTWAHAKTLVGETTPVTSVSLVLDSGWGGNQVVDLTSATVNGNTFTPAAGSEHRRRRPTCRRPRSRSQDRRRAQRRGQRAGHDPAQRHRQGVPDRR